MTHDLPGHALAFAARGWPVFPCRPDSGPGPCPYLPAKCQCKAPLTSNGFLDASTDPAVISTWWSRWPAANVAIATGAPGPDVLDVDIKPGGTGFPAFNRLKAAGLLAGAHALVRTPSGGLHTYYAGTDQRAGSKPKHYLDFRSAGGYVLAPPSAVHGRPYELIEERAAAGRFDWQAAKQLLDPPPRRPATRAAAWTGGDLPPSVRRALAADATSRSGATDRSAALHRLVGTCVRAGLDEGTIRQLAGSYPPAVDKYGPRLDTEVTRCLTRIGTA